MPDQDRVAIIGAGHVGATTAYALMLRGLFREIILIDSDAQLAAAEAEDIADANISVHPAHVWAGCYADAATAGIAIITAGVATHGDESRLSIADQSALIVRTCVNQLMTAGFDGLIVVAANPVDLMTLVALKCSNLPSTRVIGTGTLLDSNRLRHHLADRFGVAPASVDGMVIGEHGDSAVVALSLTRIGGQSLTAFCGGGQPTDAAAVEADIHQAAYRIIRGKGYTSFGVAMAIARICEAIVGDEHVVLPVSTLMTGKFGLEGICLSLPSVVGAAGVERVLLPALSKAETAALHASASVVRQAAAALHE